MSPFFLTVMFAGSLFLSPLYTQHIYWAAYRLEWVQIAIDNAATVFGQAGRAVFKELISANKRINLAEKKHHPTHFCYLPKCKPIDRFQHQWIQTIHHQAFQEASSRWTKAIRDSQSEFSRVLARHQIKGATPYLLFKNLPLSVPIRQRRCAICGLNAGWELNGMKTIWFLFKERGSLQVREDWVLRRLNEPVEVGVRFTGGNLKDLDFDYQLVIEEGF